MQESQSNLPMKACIRCRQKKTPELFARAGNSYRGICKRCAADDQKVIRKRRKKVGLCTDCGKRSRPGKTTCLKCQQVNNKNRDEYRRKQKSRAVAFLGGSCFDCRGKFIDAVFHFHHKDENQKDSDISRMLHWKWENFQKELKKCVLLCANCHITRHFGGTSMT